MQQGYRVRVQSLLCLTHMQYSRNDVTLIRGHFRVKGEVIDIFPADSEERAVRIEMFDDEVESIRTFNPSDQLSIANIARVAIVPNLNTKFSQKEKKTPWSIIQAYWEYPNFA